MTALLNVMGLSKRFAGVVAADCIDLQVQTKQIHALIGPNGAGKSTVVAMLAGQMHPDAGQIQFDGRDITRLAAHERARCGLVRSFQITRLFASCSVIEHVMLALLAPHSPWRAWQPFHADLALRQRALEILVELGIEPHAEQQAVTLAHGQQRKLEVGMALASQPLLLLLDEPMAGLGPQESAQMEQLIARLRTRCAVLLIEHDVSAVFRLADRITVLAGGAVLASGPAEQVRSTPAVVQAYLGDEVGDEALA
jgi:ABC-type branched-subunit amino acid transport system ATPase component